MEPTTVLMGLILVAGFYMAWNIGANDVANAMGTSVGSRSLTLRQAVIVAAVLEFAGAFFVGSHVTETVRSGIIDSTIFASDGNGAMIYVYAMLAALLAAGVWLQVATFFGWPVSTTHSIVGAIIGVGAAYGGMGAVHWDKVGEIVASWVISPLLAAAISYILFRIVLNRIFHRRNPVEAAKRLAPILVFAVFFILTLAMLFKGLKNLNLHLTLLLSLAIAVAIGAIAGVISLAFIARVQADEQSLAAFEGEYIARGLDKARMHLRRVRASTDGDSRTHVQQVLQQVESLFKDVKQSSGRRTASSPYYQVERIFVYLQILSACFVAFAHGANDVANAIGPLSGAVQALRSGVMALEAEVPMWALGLGGVGIVIGLATWGWRVMETIGKRITELTPSRGFCAEFAAATTIVVASKLGWPISTTHTLVGAVLGVGIARGIGALNLNTIRDILISWVVTIPVGAGLAILFFYIVRAIFGA